MLVASHPLPKLGKAGSATATDWSVLKHIMQYQKLPGLVLNQVHTFGDLERLFWLESFCIESRQTAVYFVHNF